MSSTRLRPALASGAAALIAAAGLTACSVERDEPSSSSSSPSPTSTSATPSPTPTVTVTATPTSTSTAPSPTPTTSAPATGPLAALLEASEFPRPAGASAWTEVSTGPAGSESFGLCQKVDLASIGAGTTTERALEADGDTRAVQQVAEFADAQTVVRARRVLESWHRDCAKRTGAQVGAREAVTVESGTAWVYSARFTAGGVERVQSLGLVADGAALTLLLIDRPATGYEPAEDPIRAAVAAAAEKLPALGD